MDSKNLLQKFYRLLGRISNSAVPTLRNGSQIKIEGLGNQFSGEYYITEVRHSFSDTEGYRVHFTCTRSNIEDG